MSKSVNTPGGVRGVIDVFRNLRLSWRLFRDERVAVWIKGIPFLSLAYVIWPADLLVDVMPVLGQLDDIAIVMLGLRAFIGLCPPKLVAWHTKQLESGQRGDEEVIDANYRVLDDESEGVDMP